MKSTVVNLANVFYEEFIQSIISQSNFIRREWIESEVQEKLADPHCRFVLIIGEPGAGKTFIASSLLQNEKHWLRYFLRKDSMNPLTAGDSQSFFFAIGHQLAYVHPHALDPGKLELVVHQRVGAVSEGSSVKGVSVKELKVSPFYHTAIRVQQEAKIVEGALSGIEIEQLTLEPRLENPDVLQYLALLDPAEILKQESPKERIQILIDGLDEVADYHGRQSVLDWLISAPELPSNIQFVITSRHHPKLDALRARYQNTLTEIRFDSRIKRVNVDLENYCYKFFRQPELEEPLRHANKKIDSVVTQLVAKADGNFSYVATYCRALNVSITSRDSAGVSELFKMESVPEGLYNLYAFFLQSIKQKISALGQIELDTNDPGIQVAPAWESIGQKLLQILAVAADPLTIDQIIQFGNIRAGRVDVGNVIQRMVPFLDTIKDSFRLYHLSLAEWITSQSVKETYPFDWVDAKKAHARIAKFYKGNNSQWSSVDWTSVDRYGLSNIAKHITATQNKDAIIQLVEIIQSNIRIALRKQFKSDLLYRKTIDIALDWCSQIEDYAQEFCTTIFLHLVRTYLTTQWQMATPGLIALMAKLGRVDEALDRIELMAPSEQRVVCLDTLMDHLDRKMIVDLGLLERMKSYAVTVSDDSLFGSYSEDNCLGMAAARIAEFDRESALSLLAFLKDPSRKNDIHDSIFLRSALNEQNPESAFAIAKIIAKERAEALLKLAEKFYTSNAEIPDNLVDEIRAEIEKEKNSKQFTLWARFAKLTSSKKGNVVDDALQKIKYLLTQRSSPKDHDSSYDLVEVARNLRNIDATLADEVLSMSFKLKNSDSALPAAAELFANWGDKQKCNDLVEKSLKYERSLKWYGPAGRIGKLGGILRKVDPEKGSALINEGLKLIDGIGKVDTMEQFRVDGVLRDMLNTFLEIDLKKSLELATAIKQKNWIRGSGKDALSDNISARATVGLRIAETDSNSAAVILEDCLRDSQVDVTIGRQDSRFLTGGFFQAITSNDKIESSISTKANFMAYFANVSNYWMTARDRELISYPTDILDLMDMPPGTAGARFSWASVFGAAAGPYSNLSTQGALDMATWITDPTERLIAFARILAQQPAHSPTAEKALASMTEALEDLPKYEPQLALDPSQLDTFMYLNPSSRALFYAALALPDVLYPDLAGKMLAMAGSEYLRAIFIVRKAIWSLEHPEYNRPEDIIQMCSHLLKIFKGDPDEILSSMLFWRIAGATCHLDSELSQRAMDNIAKPFFRGLAKIDCLIQLTPEISIQEFLKNLPSEIGQMKKKKVRPHQIAAMVVYAKSYWTDLDKDSEATFNELIEEQKSKISTELEKAILEHQLCKIAEGSELNTHILSMIEHLKQVENPNTTNNISVKILALAIATGDRRFAMERLKEILSEGSWSSLMAAIENAAQEVLITFGPDIFRKIDSTARMASKVVRQGQDDILHLDGVLIPKEKRLTNWWDKIPDTSQTINK